MTTARVHVGLALAIALYIGLRAAMLHFAFDQTAMPNYELYPMGTVPALVLLGSDIPLHLHYDNAAGQIVTGLLAVPFYAALGTSYLVLKLVPALLGLGTVIVGYLLLASAFGRAAAVVGALLLAVGPAPLLAKYSLMASGNHFENLFFTTLAVFCAYRFHVAARRRTLWLFLAGATSGLAIFVFLGALLPVALLVLLHVAVRGLRTAARDALVAVPALVLGAAPLILLNLGTEARGASFLESKFGDSRHLDLGRIADRVSDFLTVDLLKAPNFESVAFISASTFTLLLLLAFAVALVRALPNALNGTLEILRAVPRPVDASPAARAAERERFERSKFMPFVWVLPLTALAYGLSNFVNGGHTPPILVAGYRYFLPTFLFANLLIGAVAGPWLAAGGVRRVGGFVLAGAALFTGLSNLAHLGDDVGRVGIGTRYEGTNFVQLARQLVTQKNRLSIEDQVRYADELPPLARHQVYTGIGFCRAGSQYRHAAREGRSHDAFLDLHALLEGLSRDVWLDVARGAGRFVGFMAAHQPDSGKFVRTNLEALFVEGGHKFARIVPEGVATPMDTTLTSYRARPVLDRARAQLEHASPQLREPLARSLGLAVGRLVRRGIEADLWLARDVLAGIPTELRPAFHYGMGWGLADERTPHEFPAAARTLVPAEHQHELLVGFGAGLRHIQGAATARTLVPTTLPAPDHEAALRGVAGFDE